MKAVLTCDIAISRVAVFAEMAWLERRPELGLLCRAAREHGNRISTATVESALPGLTDTGARNVIAWCRMLALCDAQGGLTALGEAVAEHDEAPVPEQGVYGLWIAEHPVLGRRVLAAERLSSQREQRFDAIVPLPIEPERNKLFRSVLDAKEQFLVRDLPANHGQRGCLVGDTRATCRLRWTLDFDGQRDVWQLEGFIEAAQANARHAMRPMEHQPESAGLDLWGLAATWATGPLASAGRWHPQEHRLAVSFQGLAETELDNFRKTLQLRRVDIPGKGTFDDVALEDVPIGPATAEDAQRWAMSRFDRHLAKHPAYRGRSEVRTLFADLTEGTPLERFSPTLPAHDELIGQPTRDPERFWSLAAPVDLAPHGGAADDLGPLRIGGAPARTGTDSAKFVRLPYRGGWSMRQLMERLLAGAIPRRVLLCDRYVRGAENLASLGLLVQALRAAVNTVTVDVWTHEEATDFKSIQAVTGRPPRGYREVFGRDFPHDRYLLLLPSQGRGFGWHMSNSPLHARPDGQGTSLDSPLRWKDLLANRVEADEVEPALRQWLIEGGR